jgi:hypothetical protein
MAGPLTGWSVAPRRPACSVWVSRRCAAVNERCCGQSLTPKGVHRRSVRRLLDDKAVAREPDRRGRRKQVTPSLARELHREWADLGGGFVVSGETAVRIDRLGLRDDGAPVTNGAELLRLLERPDEPRCSGCDRQKRGARRPVIVRDHVEDRSFQTRVCRRSSTSSAIRSTRDLAQRGFLRLCRPDRERTLAPPAARFGITRCSVSATSVVLIDQTCGARGPR